MPDYEDSLSGEKVFTSTEALAKNNNNNNINNDNSPDQQSPFVAKCFSDQDLLTSHNKSVLGEIEKNTRSVRCLEKTMVDETKAIQVFTESLKHLNQTLINNATEERRVEEDRKRKAEEAQKPEKRKRSEDRENSRGASPKVKTMLDKLLTNKLNNIKTVKEIKINPY